MSPRPFRPPTDGKTVFVTQVVENRAPFFQLDSNCELLLATLREVKRWHPFSMLGYCILPDHFHLMVDLDDGTIISIVMQSLKRNFTREFKKQNGVIGNLRFWQKGFYDHIIRDQEDWNNHLDYIHLNAVRHRYTDKPESWRWSTYREWCKRGGYAEGWGWTLSSTLDAIAQRAE